MFEYHGWATLRDSNDDLAIGGKADDLSQESFDAIQRAIAPLQNDLQTADLRASNGSMHLWLAGLRNHRKDEVVRAYERVADLARWSYGVLYVLDDEAPGNEGNHWVSWVMKRGLVAPQPDGFLSPHVGEVEDE